MNEVSWDETTSSINKWIEQWEQKSEWWPKWNKSVLQKQQGKADAETLRPKSRQSMKQHFFKLNYQNFFDFYFNF